MIDRRDLVSVGLALLLAGFTGCGDDSSTPSAPNPIGSGTVKLVPPVGCVPIPCAGATIDNIVIRGPRSFAPFSIIFTITNTLPFMPAGSYTLSDASFLNPVQVTTGCPGAGFTVAEGKTTTVTFAIASNVCSVTVQGPA